MEKSEFPNSKFQLDLKTTISLLILLIYLTYKSL